MKRWMALLALLPLGGCIGMLRMRYEQQVEWDDGAPFAIEVWLSNEGPTAFPEAWGWLLLGDVLITPLFVVFEAVEGSEALVRDDREMVGGVFGVLICLLPGFTALTLDEYGSRWRGIHAPLSLPSAERLRLMHMEREQRVEWLLAQYAAAPTLRLASSGRWLDFQDRRERLEAIGWWVADVRLVPRESLEATGKDR